MNFEKITKRCLHHWSCWVEQRLWEMSEFEVGLPTSSWRHVLYPLSWLGSITVLSLLFLLVRMHQRLNLINGLYALLFSVSAVGIPVEVSPVLSPHSEIVTSSSTSFSKLVSSPTSGTSTLWSWRSIKSITVPGQILIACKDHHLLLLLHVLVVLILPLLLPWTCERCDSEPIRLIDTGRRGPQCML